MEKLWTITLCNSDTQQAEYAKSLQKRFHATVEDTEGRLTFTETLPLRLADITQIVPIGRIGYVSVDTRRNAGSLTLEGGTKMTPTRGHLFELELSREPAIAEAQVALFDSALSMSERI